MTLKWIYKLLAGRKEDVLEFLRPGRLTRAYGIFVFLCGVVSVIATVLSFVFAVVLDVLLIAVLLTLLGLAIFWAMWLYKTRQRLGRQAKGPRQRADEGPSVTQIRNEPSCAARTA